MKLYKYRSLSGSQRSWTEKIIKDRELYFAAPSKFNDPFEFLFQLTFTGTPEDKMDFLSKTSPEIFELLQSYKKADRDDYLSKLNSSAFENAVNNWTNKIKNQTGVLCLSDSPYNINMWSYYADNNYGVCLEFEFDEEPFANSEFKVEYSEQIPVIDYFKQNPSKLSETAKVFTNTKYFSWEHEKEYRMISSSAGAIKFNDTSLKGVYLGLNFNLKDEFIDLLRKEFPSINVYLLKKSKTKYELEAKDKMPVKLEELWRH